MKNIGDALQKLENDQGIKLEDLQSNELFITILTQASNSAIRAHQKEKLEYLRNAVVNTAIQNDIKEDLKLLFIRYVDELTVSHIVLLNFLYQHETEIAESKTYEQLFQSFATSNVLTLDRDEFKLLCQDLTTRNLLRISSSVDDFAGIYDATLLATTAATLGPKIKVTSLGKYFLGYINHTVP